MSRPLRIVFMGTPDFAVPSLRALVEAGHHVALAVMQPDRPHGRKKEPQPPPVKVAATELGIPVAQPRSLRKGPFPEQIRELAPDLAVVVAYGRIIPADMLVVPRLGFVNVHASLLPKYRGAAPIQHAIIRGESVTGITIMQLDPGLDTGDILHQVSCPVGRNMTSGELHDTLAPLGARALLETLPHLIDGTAAPEPQDDSEATLAPILSKEDGRIDWGLTAEAVFNHVRGVHPWPGAFTTWRGQTLKIHPLRELRAEGHGAAEPGQVLAVGAAGIEVACREGSVVVTELQLEGRKRMDAGAFLRGQKMEPGDVLGLGTETK